MSSPVDGSAWPPQRRHFLLERAVVDDDIGARERAAFERRQLCSDGMFCEPKFGRSDCSQFGRLAGVMPPSKLVVQRRFQRLGPKIAGRIDEMPSPHRTRAAGLTRPGSCHDIDERYTACMAQRRPPATVGPSPMPTSETGAAPRNSVTNGVAGRARISAPLPTCAI
jgi:hypothetical protein